MNTHPFNFRKIYPHIIAIGVFLVLTITYFSPVVFDKKDLFQGDMNQVEGMGKAAKDFHKETGEYTLWSPNMFSGMPEIVTGAPSQSIFSKLAQFFRFDLPGNHMGMFFCYLLCFYIFMLCIGANVWLAILGAIAYALASYNIIIIEAGHVTKGYAMAYIAPMLGGILLTFRKKYIVGSLLTLFFLGLEIYANHIQITYYALLMVITLSITYMIYYLIKEKNIKDFSKAVGLLLIASMFAILANVENLLPTQDYAKDTMRGGSELTIKSDGSHTVASPNDGGLEIDYAYSWSYGKMETFTLLIPNLYGGGQDIIEPNSETAKELQNAGLNIGALPTYWGEQPFTSGPVYAGAVICFLFVLGLFVVKGPEKWWLLAVTILSFLLAWGKNFGILNNFLFEYLPLYNKFRTPSMALIIAGISMPILAMIGLKNIFDQKLDKDKVLKYLKYSLGIVGGICLLFILLGSSFFTFGSANDAGFMQRMAQANFPSSAIDQVMNILENHRKSMLIQDSWRSLGFIVVTFLLLWAYMKNKIKDVRYVTVALILIVLIDMWSVDKRYLSDANFVTKKQALVIQPTEADLQILQDPDPNYRVFNAASNTFNEANTSYFHKSIGGYSPAKLRRYQDIIDFHFSKGLNISVLNMLNTKYFIAPNGQVQLNEAALGHAWFVDSIRLVNNPDEEILALTNFDPKYVAIIDKNFNSSLTYFTPVKDSLSSLVLTAYQPNKISYQSKAKSKQLAVFSEVFYRNWRASIDGKEVPLLRANYILRALVVPEGEHTIVFTYDSEIYHTSRNITLYNSILIGILFLGGIVYLCFAKRKKQIKK
ncbi:MAG: hypothetical protein RR393_03400 [Bacteroidales bacterium]